MNRKTQTVYKSECLRHKTGRRALAAPRRALVSRRRALAARTAPSTVLGDWSSKHILSHTTEHVILLDHLTSAPPRPPGQRSGTSSSATQSALGDCVFDHPTSARGLLRPLSDHSLRPTARGLIFSATCEI
jgi:hypothetical protein